MSSTPHGYSLHYAALDASSSGDNTVVAAVPGMKIRVVHLYLISAGDVTVEWQSGASGTTIGGPTDLTSQTGYVLNPNEYGWFETAAGELLNVNLDAAVQVGGALGYFLT